MADLILDSRNSIHFLHALPSRLGAPTFVFVNALTGSTEHWEAVVAPALRALGFGTLTYNFRGQEKSEFAPDLELTNGRLSMILSVFWVNWRQPSQS